MSVKCTFCDSNISDESWESFLKYYWKDICQLCIIRLPEEIYNISKYCWWWIIHIIYKDLLESSHNRKNRIQIRNYRKILSELKHKYNFMCVFCWSKDNLTIDHIYPVSRWWTDEIDNLQILCKSCNSKKSNKI